MASGIRMVELRAIRKVEIVPIKPKQKKYTSVAEVVPKKKAIMEMFIKPIIFERMFNEEETTNPRLKDSE
jgi:hypothetical protein